MDEEELQKRFTDCVYFLASPLTCKKGIECVYRHSEIARLNPRDCWYWLGGCCYNPECAFRHPPLEGLKEAYHEPLNPSYGPTSPVDKTNVPCYFYSKGFCNKADRCPFLHEPADCNKPMIKNEVPCENKLPNTEPTPVHVEKVVHTYPDPPDTAETEHTDTVMRNHTPDSHQLASRSESVESEENIVESEENVVESEENVVESEDFVVENESDVYNDHSSDGYVEREKWLDLNMSPGFDVFVEEGESERLEYEYEEDDVDFFKVNDDEHVEVGFISAPQSRVSIFNRLSFKKRNVHKKLIFNVQRGLGPDLRNRLKNNKVVDFEFDHRVRRNVRPRGFRGEVDFVDQRGQRGFRGEVDFVDQRGQHGFRGEVDFVDHREQRGSRGEADFVDHRGWLTKAVPVNRYKPPLKKPQLRKPALQQKRESWKESVVFTGPKTLDQIKEEKKRARGNVGLEPNNRTGSGGFFQGPRPLSEILKNKRKLVN